MGSNIIELAKLGHERAAELKASCGAVDVRSLAQLISDLATQLEVQFVRSTNMAVQLANAESKCRELAAENARLLPKAASELSNAWVLHKYLIGIQAAIMYLDNGNKKDAQEWLYGTIAGPGFEFPDEVDDIDAWATHQMRDSISHPRALEIIAAANPATVLALLDELEAAEKRMAELEERTVTLPEPFKMAKSSSGLTYYYADEVDAAIQSTGIGVKGE
ncbi:TPA: ead/Ea22-like family protein [Escherichia coli]